MINFRRIFAWPSQSIRVRHDHPPPLAQDDRNTSGLDRIPVAIVDADAVETLDHLGGAGAGFDGLEEAEGDQGAATFVVQALRVDDEGWLTCPGITPRWAGCHPRTRPSTISRTSHLHSEGKL